MEFVQQLGDPRLVELYRYWQARRGPRFAPRRVDIDPTDIPRLLPHLLLVDISADGRPRFRLVGTEVERHFGCCMTGRHIDELMRGEYLTFIEGLYRTILEDRIPVYSENSYHGDATGFDAAPDLFRTARLMLPLSEDGEQVDMVLAGQVFTSAGTAASPTVFVTQDRFDVLRRGQDAVSSSSA